MIRQAQRTGARVEVVTSTADLKQLARRGRPAALPGSLEPYITT